MEGRFLRKEQCSLLWRNKVVMWLATCSYEVVVEPPLKRCCCSLVVEVIWTQTTKTTKLATRIWVTEMTESVASGSQSVEVQGGSSTSSSSPMASYFGRTDTFDPKVEEWSTYVERLEMFFAVNNVPDSKKAASLLTLIGGRMYALLKSLTTQGDCGEYGTTFYTKADCHRWKVQVP